MFLNLCTAVLPNFSFKDVVEIAALSGCQGIELRVNDKYHKSLEDLNSNGSSIKRQIESAGLRLPILSSHIAIDDEESIDRLLLCCQKMNVPKARVVLPRSCSAAVSQQAKVKQTIPSYEACQKPVELLNSLKQRLKYLERKADKAGIKLLLELHWGTVMSSFSSARSLTYDLDPNCIGITFDPANMMIEGKEDWEYGIDLIRSYLDNVHVKNVRWISDDKGWSWEWTPVTHGMVDWANLILLLNRNQYSGNYAIEDFLVPKHDKKAAINYLNSVQAEFSELHEGSVAKRGAEQMVYSLSRVNAVSMNHSYPQEIV